MKQKLLICAIVIVIALLFAACDKWPEIEEGKAVKVIYARGEHVHAGDEITFYYRPINHPPHALKMDITYQDFSNEERCLDYEVKDSIYKSSFVTPDSVMSLNIFPMGDGRQPRPLAFIVHDENEDPVRGALGALAGSWWMGGSEYGDSLFKEELAKNPDMVVFYRNRWFRYSFRDETWPIIEREVVSLKAHTDENYHIYGVLASGYAILGELDSALASMRKYLEYDDIHSEIAPQAANDLDTYSSIYGKEDRSEEWDIKQQMALRFPMNYTAEDYVKTILWNKQNRGKPDSITERIIEARIEGNPESYFFKSVYLDQVGDSVGAVAAAEGYVTALERGEIAECGWYVSNYAPQMFRRLADYNYAEGNYQTALTQARKAIEYDDMDDRIGRQYVLAAKCNVGLGKMDSAKSDIIQAVVKGAIEEAKELLPDIYPNLQPEEALKAVFVEASELAPKAPEFIVVTEGGDTISPGDAILCMDFWNPGCGPCVAEMPLLSKFAGDRQDSRIRFLSITAAPPEHFETTEYPLDNWELCPSNRQVFMDMKVGAIPHFFLVDGRGHVRFNQIGAPLDTASVGLLLDMLLAEGELAKGEAEPSD